MNKSSSKNIYIIVILFVIATLNSIYGHSQQTVNQLKLENEKLKKEIEKLKIEKNNKLLELAKEKQLINNKLELKENILLILKKQVARLSEEILKYNITTPQFDAYNILKNQQLYTPTESGNKKLLSFTRKLKKSKVIPESALILITSDNNYWYLSTAPPLDERLEFCYEIPLNDKQLKIINKLKNKGLLIFNTDKQNLIKQLTGIDDGYIKMEEEKEKLNLKIGSLRTSIRELKNELEMQDKVILDFKGSNEGISSLENNMLLNNNKILSIISEQKQQKISKKFNKTVKKKKIGYQVWMTKNLNVAFFSNGEKIPYCKTQKEKQLAKQNKQPCWCYYNDDPKNNFKYGKLYNKYVVSDSRGLAPLGWHLPSDEDWWTLYNEIDSNYTEKPCKDCSDDYNIKMVKVKKMMSTSWRDTIKDEIKCKRCENWPSEFRRKEGCWTCKDTRVSGYKTTIRKGNNSSGFNAIEYVYDNLPLFASRGATWWSSDESYLFLDWITFDIYDLENWGRGKNLFLSVRLIQDTEGISKKNPNVNTNGYVKKREVLGTPLLRNPKKWDGLVAIQFVVDKKGKPVSVTVLPNSKSTTINLTRLDQSFIEKDCKEKFKFKSGNEINTFVLSIQYVYN